MEIRPIPHPLTGLFEGIQGGVSFGLTMNKLKQEQQEREELLNLQKQKAQAEQEYRERESNRKTLENWLKVLNDEKMPKDIKLQVYNSMVVPIGKRLELPLEVINDWPDGIEEYVEQALNIYNNKDYTWSQKKELIGFIMMKAGGDERFKHIVKNIEEKLEQEQQLAEQEAYRLYSKFLNNEITPDEANELERILEQNYNAYKNGVVAAINKKKNELLAQKTQEEIKNLGTDYKVYYHPVKKDTILVNVKDPTKIEEARKQGYRLYVRGFFESRAGESEYTLPQKLDDLRAWYDRMVDALRTEYGLKYGGPISKTFWDLSPDQKKEYLERLEKINAMYNEEYRKLTGRDAPFLATNAGKRSSGERPSLDEIFRGK